MLDLRKDPNAPGNYNDGLFYFLETEKKPQHIHAVMKTTEQDIESCDIRLTTIKNDDNQVEENQFLSKEF